MSVAAFDQPSTKTRQPTREEKKVILASSLGTVFEWYDFFLYGALATWTYSAKGDRHRAGGAERVWWRVCC